MGLIPLDQLPTLDTELIFDLFQIQLQLRFTNSKYNYNHF